MTEFYNASVALIETSQLICTASQLSGFYMRATLAFNGLSICDLSVDTKHGFKGNGSFTHEQLALIKCFCCLRVAVVVVDCFKPNQ